jgi:hypothetical protein
VALDGVDVGSTGEYTITVTEAGGDTKSFSLSTSQLHAAEKAQELERVLEPFQAHPSHFVPIDASIEELQGLEDIEDEDMSDVDSLASLPESEMEHQRSRPFLEAEKMGQPRRSRLHTEAERRFSRPSKPRPQAANAEEGQWELDLDIAQMPVAKPNETHRLQVLATNPGGGSSEPSPVFETDAIARQQGAAQAQDRLQEAIKVRRVSQLSTVLQECQGIELPDMRQAEGAKKLLKNLHHAKADLRKAMQARDPEQLRQALAKAKDVELPNLEPAEVLLHRLDSVLLALADAKGVEELRTAVQEAYDIQLSPVLLRDAVTRLDSREMANHGLEQAMAAKRVLLLKEALKLVRGMTLPLEDEGKRLLEALEEAESSLRAALRTGLIDELRAAIDLAAACSLHEPSLIAHATAELDKMVEERDVAEARLRDSMEACDPRLILAALEDSGAWQVPNALIEQAKVLHRDLARLLAAIQAAVGVDERAATLQAAQEAYMPQDILRDAQRKLDMLVELNAARKGGHFRKTQRSLMLALTELKDAEMAEARKLNDTWSRIFAKLSSLSALLPVTC